MTYKIGTRVRNVRGKFGRGGEGVILSIEPNDQAWLMPTNDWFGSSGLVGKGEIGVKGKPSLVGRFSEVWEPIVDPGASPGIKGTCEPLDKLLSEVSREAAE